MSNSDLTMRATFPLQVLDVKLLNMGLWAYYQLVLRGDSSPTIRPIFLGADNLGTVAVDNNGLWNLFEWSLLPQLYDPSSPWLTCIPIYNNETHFTRSRIVRSMMVEVERYPDEKSPLTFTAKPDLYQLIKDKVPALMKACEESMRDVQEAETGVQVEEVCWPKETLARAKYLYGQLIFGVTSFNSFIRCLSSLRRVFLELSGFAIWCDLMLAKPNERSALATSYKVRKDFKYRGSFLSGSKNDWLDPNSAVRRAHITLTSWTVPTYAVVNAAEWDLSPFEGLPTGGMPFQMEGRMEEKEEHQLVFYCYPPTVPARLFERAARGLSAHSEEGKRGAIADFTKLTHRRLTTRLKQSIARPDPALKPVDVNQRPNPEWQAKLTAKAAPPFMPFFKFNSSIAGDYLAPNVGTGTLLPRAFMVWGADDDRRIVMVESVATFWKLFAVRSSLFRRGDLAAKDAYLNARQWRDLLVRKGKDSDGPVPWTGGRKELWGSLLLPAVIQRARQSVSEPTVKRMDTYCQCRFLGMFTDDNDPGHKLQHFVLFRLTELQILHDFASYHPDLQLQVDGRWCPPPFELQAALDDRPTAFPSLIANTSEAEERAMQEILTIVRWNGDTGIRAWEMGECQSYREWLTAFRALLSKSSNAWSGNRVLDGLMKSKPDIDLLSVDLTSPETPLEVVRRVALLLLETHVIQCMRAGRVPCEWPHKPDFNDFKCIRHW